MILYARFVRIQSANCQDVCKRMGRTTKSWSHLYVGVPLPCHFATSRAVRGQTRSCASQGAIATGLQRL